MSAVASLRSIQFVRYCAAGSLAAATHFVLLAVLVEAYAVPPTLASAFGFGVAVLVNYVLQYYWTFSASGAHGRALAKFTAVACLGLGLNTCIFWASYRVLGMPYMLAQMAATGLVVLVNFSMNRRFVFAPHAHS